MMWSHCVTQRLLRGARWALESRSFCSASARFVQEEEELYSKGTLKHDLYGPLAVKQLPGAGACPAAAQAPPPRCLGVLLTAKRFPRAHAP